LFLVFSSAIIKGEQAQTDLFSELLKFAGKGNAEAGYHMVCFYHLSINTKKDRSKAFDGFQKAAFLGDPLA
jgi:TPR repeat protein